MQAKVSKSSPPDCHAHAGVSMLGRAIWLLAAVAIPAAVPLSASLAIAVQNDQSQEKQRDDAKTEKIKPKVKGGNLDDALLDDLDNELLEGAGDLKRPAGKPKAEGTKPGDGDKPKSKSQVGGEDIGIPMEDEQVDPLVHVSQDMRTVEELIPKSTNRAHAEELQRRIVEDLAKLIEQAEAQSAAQQAASKNKKQPSSAKRQSVKQSKPGSPANSQQNSSKPAQDSTNRLGKAEDARPDPELMKGLMKDSWGNLPPRAREQMLQNSPERFLPQYELMIERYYQRLAEESSSK